MKTRGASRAFTLVELLAVMAILLLLAMLLLPALHHVKEKARAALCLGNLRQWGIATQLLIDSNRDFLPRDGFATPTLPGHFKEGWYVQLPAALGVPPYREMPWRTNASIDTGRSIWVCPSNPRRSNGNLLFHYCLNQCVNGTGSENKPTCFTSIASPSAVVWLFDNRHLPAVGNWNYVHTNLHNHGAQLLFLDGHARWFASPDYWDYAARRGRTDNPEVIWKP